MKLIKPSGRLLRAALWTLGGLAAWLVLLDLSKVPLLVQVDPSWIAVLTRARAAPLQFGQDIVYTYGPLCHLVFSTFSEELFTGELIARCLLAGFYVLLLCVLSKELPAPRRAFFFLGALIISILSYQSLYLFAIVGCGWLLCRESVRPHFLLAPALLFVATASLIKFTFLWLTLLVLAVGAVSALVQRHRLRAVVPTALFLLLFCLLWALCGQNFGNLGAFLRTGWDVTSGYSRTMSLPAKPEILAAGIGTALLTGALFLTLLFRSRRTPAAFTMWVILSAGLFLAWKLGFCRADSHTDQFFYFAILLSLAAPIFFDARRDGLVSLVDWSVLILVAGIGTAAIVTQTPGVGATLLSNLRSRAITNPKALLHPVAERARWRAADLAKSADYNLPRIRERVGRASVTVFGWEQSVALANQLNFVPIPTVQAYCGYTNLLHHLDAMFFRSERAPEFVLFKLQPIDRRLPTTEDPEVLLQLAQDYHALTQERGYLLLQRNEIRTAPIPQALPVVKSGKIGINRELAVPAGSIWGEFEFRPRLLGRLVAFLYQPPLVEMEISTTNGETLQRRIQPSLSDRGFLVSPLLLTDADFVRFASGQVNELPVVKSIRLRVAAKHLFHREVAYRFRSIPSAASGSGVSADVLRDLLGYTDVFSRPAALVHSSIPPERFVLDGRQFLLVHPVGEVRFDVPAGATKASGFFGIRADAYLGTEGVEFEVACTRAGAPEVSLYRRMLTPRTTPSDRGAQQFQVELPAAPGQLVLRTLPGPTRKIDWGWAGWSTIRFEDGTAPGP